MKESEMSCRSRRGDAGLSWSLQPHLIGIKIYLLTAASVGRAMLQVVQVFPAVIGRNDDDHQDNNNRRRLHWAQNSRSRS